VISTPVKDVVRQYTDTVSIVRTGEEFLAEAERLLKNPDPERIKLGIEKARGASWENTVKTMQGLIRDSIKKDDRRSIRKISPLSDIEIAYQYAPTQGS
jgi:hypothetical protein